MEPKFSLIYIAVVVGWRRMPYTYAGLEDEVEIRIMSFCGAVVKSGYPLASAAELWLAEGHVACYARDVLQDLRANSMSLIMLDATIGLIS
jgi:hypothetical protein